VGDNGNMDMLPWLPWSVPQLPIMIIYNCTWSILIQYIRIILSAKKTDLENTKESILLVCDKPYYNIKENMPHGGGA